MAAETAVFAQHNNNSGVSTALHRDVGSEKPQKCTTQMPPGSRGGAARMSLVAWPQTIQSVCEPLCILGHVFASSRLPSLWRLLFGAAGTCVCIHRAALPPALASKLSHPSGPSSSSSSSFSALSAFLSPAIPSLRCAKTLHLRVPLPPFSMPALQPYCGNIIGVDFFVRTH